MRMWIYIVRRALLVVPIIIGVITITFIITNAIPTIDILQAHYGCTVKACPGSGTWAPGTQRWNDSVAALGLNQPAPVRWATYLYNSLTFNWGTVSINSAAGKTTGLGGLAVTTVFAWELPYTIELAVFALIIILIVAIPLGNLSAVYRNRPVDQASRVMSFSGFALPAFLLGSLALVAVVLALGSTTNSGNVITPWCPTPGEIPYFEFFKSWPQQQCFSGGVYPAWLGGGTVYAGLHTTPTGFPTLDAAIHGNYWLSSDTIIRMILPALVIAFGTIATLLRFVRNSMLEVMNLDFVRTARAKGVPEKTVVSRHAGRNSLNVTITVLGLTFAFFIGGFPIIEDVFGLNGIGYILAQSVNVQNGGLDINVIFGSTLLFTYLVVVANIVVDVLYAYLDPRVRLG